MKKLVALIGAGIFLPLVVHGDNLTTLAVLTGQCKSATAMDVAADPKLCLDKVVNFDFRNFRPKALFFDMNKGSIYPHFEILCEFLLLKIGFRERMDPTSPPKNISSFQVSPPFVA